MSAAPLAEGVEESSPSLVRGATGFLADLNRLGVLDAADIHVALRLGRLAGCDDELVLLAAALTVRAVRIGSVCLDLGRLDEVLTTDDLPARSWPTTDGWRELLLTATADRPLVRVERDEHSANAAGTAAGAEGAVVTPLVLDGDLLYLDRYWFEEGQVRLDLLARFAAPPPEPTGLEATLDRYFPVAGPGADDGVRPDDFADQRAAARTAARSGTSVITGGPGTGKTTTIARMLGVLLEQDPTLRVALAAPTGRAAARLAQAVRAAVLEGTRAGTFPGAHAEALGGLRATTLHRLLGWRPDQRSRFRHHRGNRLPYDVVVVDETSMVSLTLMARLLEAVRPATRLVLVGDPDQLASVDAGAVLGDLEVGLAGQEPPVVAELTRNRRFEAGLTDLANAIRAKDADAVLAAVADAEEVSLVGTEEIDELVLAQARALREAATSGDEGAALRQLDAHRLLCAHREGPAGANTWNRRVETALAARDGLLGGLGPWYPGRPVIVTENDYALGLFNGDTGVVMLAEGDRPGLRAVLGDGSSQGRSFATARLSEVRSAHAMTVHRSQGSQVDEVTVLLPEDASPLLTRQLLYTAVTRARRRVRVAGSQDAVRRAVTTDAPRASGLAERLRRP